MYDLQRLRTALQGDLPGHDRFLRLSGYRRPDIEEARAQEPPPRESAVMIALFPQDGRLHTLLMLRPTYDGVHSGQVGFPGGKHEPGDASLEHTARREFMEETGSRAVLEVIGRLTPMYIPPSRLVVTPFIGTTADIGPLAPEPYEVAALIPTPLERLLGDDVKLGQQYVHVMGGRLKVPYFDVQGHAVWGATAMMIAELRTLWGAS